MTTDGECANVVAVVGSGGADESVGYGVEVPPLHAQHIEYESNSDES